MYEKIWNRALILSRIVRLKDTADSLSTAINNDEGNPIEEYKSMANTLKNQIQCLQGLVQRIESK